LPVDAHPHRHEPDTSWVNDLRDSGYETIHSSSIGPATAKNREIFDHARENGYVILTNDLDFPQILAHTKETAPSVIILRGEPLVPEMRGDAMLRVLDECHAELTRGAVVSLDWSDRPRASVLPLG
jgi:predicted nuclease of predicted toxin-antitoxin system